MATDPPTVIVAAKAWWESRALWLNAIGFLVLIVGAIVDNAQLVDLPPAALGILGMVLAVANAALRFLTSTPLASGPHQTAEVEAPR